MTDQKSDQPGGDGLPLDVRVQTARYAFFRLLRANAPHERLCEEWSKLETLLDSPTRDGAEGCPYCGSPTPNHNIACPIGLDEMLERAAPPKPTPHQAWEALKAALELKITDSNGREVAEDSLYELRKAVTAFLAAPVLPADGANETIPDGFCSPSGTASCLHLHERERCSDCPVNEKIDNDARDRFEATRLSPSGTRAAKPDAWPIETAPKNHTWVRLLVDYSDEQIAFPLFDSAEPSWTVGHNGESDTGEPSWTFMGWDWDQDCIVETNKGKVIGWLPFYATPPIRGDREAIAKVRAILTEYYPVDAEFDTMWQKVSEVLR